ncbi:MULTISPECIES: deoxyribose-phosphate aldolase [unclassified Luteococcus]|uniref:deoxyribose-phosphate aldolase n=1 Tax=unclassified Luteococcus TaxID=2639923 RepID=UPI00313CB0B5
MTTNPTRTQLAQMIDHTVLKPEATLDQIQRVIDEAATLGTYSVCLSPSHLPIAVPNGIKLAVVCGFPSGAHSAETKAYEAGQAARAGADEVDMVINLRHALEGHFDLTEAEILAVRRAVPAPVVLKVIIESAALNDDTIVQVCQAAARAGADFVKTSTGFHPAGGASVHAVELMAKTVGGRLGVKASGGIRDSETALAMVAAGATRLGLSASAAVLNSLGHV